jgi:hypothetical protein
MDSRPGIIRYLSPLPPAPAPERSPLSPLILFCLFLAILKFVFPFLAQDPVYEPHRDEFLYLAEGRHLAWGYLEAPPLMSLLGFFSNLLGGGTFWIKIWPSLFGSLTWLITARLILSLGGRWFALVLGFLPFVFGYFTHVHFMFQPNFLEVFFWTLMAYGLISHAQTGKATGLWLAGVGLGLGMMSKYSVAIFAVSLLVGFLINGETRIWLNKHFYYALLLALILFLPNLIWQYVHGFPVVYHMRELERQQLEKVSRSGFLLDQLWFNLPSVYIWVAGWWWVSFSREGRPFRFLGLAIILALGVLFLAHGKSYYGMGAYPLLFGFGAVVLERWTENRFLALRYAMLAFTFFSGCLIDLVSLPILAPGHLAHYYAKMGFYRRMGFLRWEDQRDHPLPQDFADMLGWEEMAQKIARIYGNLSPEEKSQVLIDGDNYGEIAATNYYGARYHLPTAMGHQANFLLWVPPNFYQSNIIILVTDDREEIHSEFCSGFRYAAVEDSLTDPLSREFRTEILLLKGPGEKVRQIWKSYYESLRKEISVFH